VKARVLALAAALLAPGALAQDAPLTVDEYAAELRAIEAALVGGALEEAARRAEALRPRQVEHAGERVAVDPVLVEAVVGARGGAARPALAMVRSVLRALPQGGTPPPVPDRALLERVQRAERKAAPAAGGQVGGMPLQPSVPQRFLDAIGAMGRWIGDAWRRFTDWLRRLWPRKEPPLEIEAGAPTVPVSVLVLAVALVLAVLAVMVMRRSSRKEPSATSEPEKASRRDEDPLSREQDEWEKYAAELAAAGRTREAIRAWYHAVLVALFRAGLLHHQKGRTNWEYVARVPPQSDWRPDFIGLTRRFDREWYGRDRSAPDSLRECASEARGILRQVRAGA
jgi:hypothetical protein